MWTEGGEGEGEGEGIRFKRTEFLLWRSRKVTVFIGSNCSNRDYDSLQESASTL